MLPLQSTMELQRGAARRSIEEEHAKLAFQAARRRWIEASARLG
jgi:hypothetical protein